MTESKVSAADVAFGYAAPTKRSLRNEIIGFVTLQRIAVDAIFLSPVAASAALAGERFNDPRFIVLLVVTWLIASASHVINDIVDTERDKRKWPLRSLPTGLISKSVAALYAALLAGTGLLIAGFVVNRLFAAMALLVLASDYVYTRYTRDKIGYLTVLVPMALIPIAIWTAVSPETVLTPLPWLLAALLAAYGAAGNIANEATDKVIVKPLFVRFKPFTEMAIYVACVIITLVLGTVILLYAQVPWAYLVVLIVLMAWALTAAKYLGSKRSQETLKKAFMTVTLSGALSTLSLAVLVWFK